MKQCDCNILHVVVSRIQLLVNRNFFHLLFFHLLSSFIYYFFDLIVKKYETNNIPKCTPFWHEMFKIVSLSWGSVPDPAGGAYDAPPDPLVGRGFLPSAIAASRLRRLIPISPPPNKNTRPISPPKHKILEPPLVICYNPLLLC